ncbi:MAG TPA: hypothetical protein VF572_06715 [Candidatus Saccharimonadales bacterium]|jgi:hypothetical protein
MKSQQHGFGALGVFSIILVLGIIGFSGWFVWQKSAANETAQDTAAKATPGNKKAAPEKYVVPAGFTLYENADHGFKFAYPTKWGEIIKTRNEAVPTLIAESSENKSANGYVNGKLQIRIDEANTFTQMAAYHAYDVKPVREGSEYTWVVSRLVGDIQGGQKVGEAYDPQPKLAYKDGGLRIYEFKLSHACGEWSDLAFPIGYNFVSITVPAFCDMGVEDTTQERSDKALAEYQAMIAKVASSIRQGTN